MESKKEITKNLLANSFKKLILDIPFKNIKSGLSKVKVAGRMELYALSKKHVDVIVDYAHNKLSYQTLLENVRDLYPNKKIMLIAGCVGGTGRCNKHICRRGYIDRTISG